MTKRKSKAKARKRPSFRQALDMGKKRTGWQIRKPIALGEKDPMPEGFIKALDKEIKAIAASNPSHQRLPTKRRILVLARQLAKYPHKPTALQVAQALARSRGIRPGELYPWLRAADRLGLRMRQHGVEAFDGSMSMFASVVKEDLLHALERRLRRAKGPHTTKELARHVGTKPARVNHALNVLEAMGMVGKTPPESAESHTPEYAWMHAEHLPRAPVPKSNMGLRVLQALEGKAMKMTGIMKAVGTTSRVIDKHLDRFLDAGAVSSRDVIAGLSRRRYPEYSLTAKGVRVVAAQAQSRHLLPEMRELLMWPRGPGPTARVDKRVRDLADRVRLRMRYERLPRTKAGNVKNGELARMAEREGLPISTMTGRFSFRKLPFREATLHRIATEFLPALYMHDPMAGMWFERWLRENRDRFPDTQSVRLLRATGNEPLKAAKKRAEAVLGKERGGLLGERRELSRRVRELSGGGIETADIRRERAAIFRRMEEIDAEVEDIEEKAARLRGEPVKKRKKGGGRRSKTKKAAAGRLIGGVVQSDERLGLIKRRHKRLRKTRERAAVPEEPDEHSEERDIDDELRARFGRNRMPRGGV